MSPIPFQPRTTDELYAELRLTPGERANVVRSGQRQPISFIVRQLVYRRDHWTCQHCGATPYATDPARRSGALHLDHIVPWSAGGSDRSDNLRTLCGPCNYDRSNFVTGHEAAVLPIVGICTPCLTMPDFKPADTFTVYCGSRSHESWALAGWHIL